MAHRLAILVLAFSATVGLPAQQKPPQPKVSGYRVTAEGGVEGTRTIRYDENGRPIDGQVPFVRPPDAGPAPRRTEVAAPRAAPAPEPAQVSVSQGLRTADGRPLPFTVSRSTGGKTVDESVDADAALRDFGRPSDLLDQRFPTNQLDLGRDDRFSTSRTVTLGTWGSTFSSLGAKRADITLQDGLGAEIRPKDTIAVRSVERRASPWSRRTTEVRGWDERLDAGPAALADRQVDDASLAGTIARANTTARSPRGLDQLSMQDINRYQFRRARSTEPGLPVVRPGSDGEIRPNRAN